MRSSLAIVALAFAATGCLKALTSTTPTTKEGGKQIPAERIYRPDLAAPSPERTATVSFLRDAGFPGSACTHRIIVDGEPAFGIRAGEYQTLHLAPGNHVFTLQVDGGLCPQYSTTYATTVREDAEGMYRIFYATTAREDAGGISRIFKRILMGTPPPVTLPRIASVGPGGEPLQHGTRTSFVLVGMADGVPKTSVEPPFKWDREASTPGTSLSLQETDRRQTARGTYVEYEMRAVGFPANAPPTLWWKSGTSYTQMPARIGDHGIVYFQGTRALGIEGYVRGAVLDLALTSGEQRAYANAIPFPLEARQGGHWASVEVVTETGRLFLITFGGFQPGEKVHVMSQLGDQRLAQTVDASPDGRVRFPVLFGADDRGTATASATGTGDTVSIGYAIGSEALVRQ